MEPDEYDFVDSDDLMDELLDDDIGGHDDIDNPDNGESGDQGSDFDDFDDFNLVDDEPNPDDNTSPVVEADVISKILADKGIADPTKIKYETDDGEIEEVNFYDLPIDEQYAILNTEEEQDYGLNDHEIEVVNYLRSNGTTLDEVIEYFQNKAVEDYIRDSALTGFGIDTVSDEELFRLDLKANYEDLTDEEIELQLEKELEHKDFFNKKVAKLRQEYLAAEASLQEEERQKQLQQEEEKYNTLANELIEVARGVDEIGGLDLSNEDKEEILSFVLDRDANGSSQLGKILDDTQSLFELAWYALKGKQAFEVIHDYYRKEIEKARKQKPKTVTKTTVIRKDGGSSQNKNQGRRNSSFNTEDSIFDFSYD